jgi:hypothetical protein
MRRARIVRIEWDADNANDINSTDIRKALRKWLDFSVTITGEPSFTVKESVG